MEAHDKMEELIANLPKSKLGWVADMRIRAKLYRLVISERWNAASSVAVLRRPIAVAAASVVLAVSVVSGASLYAYDNAQITMASRLYPLRRMAEGAKSITAISEVSKASTYDQLTYRRLSEALVLSQAIEKDDTAVQEDRIIRTVDNAMHYMDDAVATLQGINDKNKAQAAITRIKTNNTKHSGLLDAIGKNIDTQKDPKVSAKVEEAKAAMKKYESFLSSDDQEEKAIDLSPTSTAPVINDIEAQRRAGEVKGIKDIKTNRTRTIKKETHETKSAAILPKPVPIAVEPVKQETEKPAEIFLAPTSTPVILPIPIPEEHQSLASSTPINITLPLYASTTSSSTASTVTSTTTVPAQTASTSPAIKEGTSGYSNQTSTSTSPYTSDHNSGGDGEYKH